MSEDKELKPRRPGAVTPIKLEGSFLSYPNDPVTQAMRKVQLDLRQKGGNPATAPNETAPVATQPGENQPSENQPGENQPG